VRRPGGGEQPYGEVVQLVLPQVALDVLRPPRRSVTGQPRVLIVGRTRPEAEVTVAGRRVRVGADGTFQHVQPLPAAGDHRIEVAASMPGLVDAVRPLEVARLSPADFRAAAEEARVRADDWAGRDALRDPPDQDLLSGAAAGVAGKKVALRGLVTSVQQGPESVVFVVSSCGEADGCLVWAELAEGPVAVGQGEQAVFFGTVEGTRKLPRPGGGETDVPFVRLQHVVGG
jgi:hypothetical protein